MFHHLIALVLRQFVYPPFYFILAGIWGGAIGHYFINRAWGVDGMKDIPETMLLFLAITILVAVVFLIVHTMGHPH